jgi:hypothetical protein
MRQLIHGYVRSAALAVTPLVDGETRSKLRGSKPSAHCRETTSYGEGVNNVGSVVGRVGVPEQTKSFLLGSADRRSLSVDNERGDRRGVCHRGKLRRSRIRGGLRESGWRE